LHSVPGKTTGSVAVLVMQPSGPGNGHGRMPPAGAVTARYADDHESKVLRTDGFLRRQLRDSRPEREHLQWTDAAATCIATPLAEKAGLRECLAERSVRVAPRPLDR
jgi:hypothetical protein